MTPVLPRHVRACVYSADETERWAIYVWDVDNPTVQCRIPYCCNSWRCSGCARHEAAVLFARLKEAQQGIDPSGWCTFVLTVDRDGYYSGDPWADVTEAYEALGTMTRAFLGRIGRRWGSETALERSGRSKELRTVRKLGPRWISVVEAHRSGWPHVNLLVWCPELAELLRSDREQRLADPELADAVALQRDAWARREPVPPAVRERARQAILAQGDVLECLEASGWGRQSSAEAVRDIEALMSYDVKLCGLHESSVGEVAKITQAPLNAPERFRRYRSGKGFLPPRRSNPAVTGTLVRRIDAQEAPGTARDGRPWYILPVHAPKDPAQVEPVRAAVRAELQLIDEESRLKMRDPKGKLAPMPPVRIVVRGQLEHHLETSERRWIDGQRVAAQCA